MLTFETSVGHKTNRLVCLSFSFLLPVGHGSSSVDVLMQLSFMLPEVLSKPKKSIS